MTEVEDLLNKAAAKIDAARLLLENGFYDDCISRVYYAMFFAAKAALLSVDVTTSTHKGLHMMFGKHFVRPGILPADLGRRLVRAFDARQTAEYEGNLARTKDEASHALQEAEQFVREIKEHLEA